MFKKHFKDNNNNSNSSVNTVSSVNGRLFTNLSINGVSTKGLVDSGASISILWDSLAKELKLNWVPCSAKVKTACGSLVTVLGKVDTIVSLGRSSNLCTFLIVKEKILNDNCIFGLSVLSKVGINIGICENKVYCPETGDSHPMEVKECSATNTLVCSLNQSTLDKIEDE
ncbi:hypothetical protein RB653_003501 [Dictyostelium firmibasis]|uniref:Peptidase A2 domain-containing protein n=1 Tax=Dictyostelium firmibasis TaxID=79012 RepID=A0AAN7U5W6_9MYCE